MTGLQTIRRSLRLIGAIAPGESIPDDEAQDALTALQAMFDSFAAQRLTIYQIEEALHLLVSGTQTYTIGPGGNINRARPMSIYGAAWVQNLGQQSELELPITVFSTQDWQRLPSKETTSTLPLGVYYDRAYPLGNLSLFPIVTGSSSAVYLKLYLPTAITGFANLTTAYAFPPGYDEAIVYNLALRLAPEWGLEVPSGVATMAAEFLGNVKRSNEILEVLFVDGALLFRRDGLYNYRTDQNP